jgi:cobalt-precorrin 5A hydrolase
MSAAIITFSKQGLILAHKLKSIHSQWSIYVHNSILSCNGETHFEHIKDKIGTIFSTYNAIIFIGPTGIAVRSISPYIGHKTTDPAVAVVDVGGRFVISLLSGHEGGANDLAVDTANIIGAEPCISTTTEAVKTITAGIGCRKGISQETIIAAIKEACVLANIEIEQIRTVATAQIKSSEQGLIDACKTLCIPLRILPDWQILRCNGEISKSEFVKEITGLPGVAEPAALISGRNTKLLLKKHIHKGVTIALAREHCLWSE